MLLFITLSPQHYDKLFLKVPEQQKSCQGFCRVRIFTYLSVAKENKQNSDMTWQKYK